ncbi:MAG: LysM peptidoglycan-binding domain-containing protein [Chloroflexota bacterium]
MTIALVKYDGRKLSRIFLSEIREYLSILRIIDRLSPLLFLSSQKNLCHHIATPEAVAIPYQETTCLTSKHDLCIVYKNNDLNRLPEEINGAAGKTKNKYLLPRKTTAVLLIAIIFVFFLYSSDAIQEYFFASPSDNNSFNVLETNAYGTAAASSVLMTPEPSTGTALIIDASITSSADGTLSPTNTLIAFQTPGPEMMTPFGPGGLYIFHEVQPGESLALLARTYETSIEVLEANNIFPLGTSLWVGQIILVMPNQIDPTGLSSFQIIQLEVRTRVAEISEEYSVSIADLKSLNSLGPDDWLPAGRWLIIPYSNETN